MCRRVSCPTCKRPDWRGCGAHIEQVLGDVPLDERCPRDHESIAAERRGWFASLLGRR